MLGYGASCGNLYFLYLVLIPFRHYLWITTLLQFHAPPHLLLPTPRQLLSLSPSIALKVV